MTELTIAMDETIKVDFDKFCKDVGLTPSIAINLFAKTVVREQRIPFEISTNNAPFYSKTNMSNLSQSIQQIKDGKVVIKTMNELLSMENE